MPADSRILDMLRYIDAHLTEDLKIDDLAEAFYISRFHMMRLFRQETGQSIRGFLTEIRIKEACKQLSSTRNNITDIATDCGFSDMKSFYAIFKKHTGLTPKQYRENN